jgi:hypothetical protein
MTPRRTLLALGVTLLVIGLALMLAPSTARAQIPDDERPPLVTDYANYPGTPQAFLTPGCDGAGMIGSSFTFDFAAGGTAGPIPDLDDAPVLAQGDLVTWSWIDVAPECVGSAVSLVVKVALGPSRDPFTNQVTGPNGGYSVEFLASTGPGEITFPMPDLARFGLGCDYQLDAIVGIPLQVIGPSGSFFTQFLRELVGTDTADTRTTLVSAQHGTYLNCLVAPTTSTSTTTTTAPTTTTTAPTTTTSAPVATTAPTTTTTPPTTTSAAQAPSPPPQTIVVVQTTPTPTTRPRPPLAETGPVTGPLPLLGATAILLGLCSLAASRPRSVYA